MAGVIFATPKHGLPTQAPQKATNYSVHAALALTLIATIAGWKGIRSRIAGTIAMTMAISSAKPDLNEQDITAVRAARYRARIPAEGNFCLIKII